MLYLTFPLPVSLSWYQAKKPKPNSYVFFSIFIHSESCEFNSTFNPHPTTIQSSHTAWSGDSSTSGLPLSPILSCREKEQIFTFFPPQTYKDKHSCDWLLLMPSWSGSQLFDAVTSSLIYPCLISERGIICGCMGLPWQLARFSARGCRVLLEAWGDWGCCAGKKKKSG